MGRMNHLIEKYNVSVPRYTSYPTMPFWQTHGFTEEKWTINVKKTISEENKLSLYIHLPYCESLCTFCACHKRITKNHSYEKPYIEAVLKEWEMYLAMFEDVPEIEEIHLGGGTPTFFSPENLDFLISSILKKTTVSEGHEFSFEGHPNNTTYAHLATLYALGFRRVSFGVQDYDPKVQQAIHRVQPFENVKNVTAWAKEIGYTSVSHDLVFGLPFQTLKGFKETVEKTLALSPDRLSLYSYAHVPWIKGIGQRGYSEENLPAAESKRELYETARAIFEANGYFEVGMDHFAKADDSMFIAYENGKLNRNFMGYTTTQSKLLIGLGASAISDAWGAMAQNEKNVDGYITLANSDKLPVTKGHIQSQRDLQQRQLIQDVMCRFKAKVKFEDLSYLAQEKMHDLEKDNIIQIKEDLITVTPAGRAFIRNVCVVFDDYLIHKEPLNQTFSKAI
jgi:oxygen-independent coproporphyrinogen-3 oxidase